MVLAEISAEALVTSLAATLILPIVAPTRSTTAVAAAAINPTSSRRPTPGIVTAKLPAATSLSGATSARSGRAIEMTLAAAEPIRTRITASPIMRSIRLARSVSAFASSLRSFAASSERGGRGLDQRVHLPAERIGALHVLIGVAVVLGRGGKAVDGGDVAFHELRELFEPVLVGRLVARGEGGFDVPAGGLRRGVRLAQRLVLRARRDREAKLAGLNLQRAEVVGRAQRFHGGEFLVAGGAAFERGPMVAELLFRQHSGHQQHADAGEDRELGANGEIVGGHWRVLRRPHMINEAG